MTAPKSLSDRVADSQRRAVKSGARRMNVILPPDAAQALDTLMQSDYAASRTGCIARALVEAARE